MTMELALTFTAVECRDCGEERAAAAPCPCGGEPGGRDPLVEDRAARLQHVLRLLERPRWPSEPGTTDPRRWLAQFSGWPEAFARALQDAVREEARPVALEQRVDALVRTFDQARATPRRRPHHRGWAVVDDILRRQQEIARQFLLAAISATPHDAYRHQEMAQEQLDASKEAAREYVIFDERAERIGESGDQDVRWGPMRGMLAEAASTGDLHRLHEVDDELLGLYEQITSTTDATPAALAGLHLQLLQAEDFCNRDRLIDVAGQVYRAAIARRERLRELLDLPEWWDAYKRLHEDLTEAGVDIRRAAPDLERPDMAARHQVRLGHSLLERCAKPLLATLWHLDGGKDFSRLAAKDVGAQIDRTRQAGLGDILIGLDKALRHADAHREFHVDDTGVHFTASSREYDYLDWDELTDRVLGGLESVFAINLGMVLAASHVGVEIDLLALVDTTDEERAGLGLALGGLHPRELAIDPPTARASCVAAREPQPGFFSAVANYLPEGVEHLELTVHIEETDHHWSADVATFRRWESTPQGPSRDALFGEALTYLHRDGHPAMSKQGLRNLAAASIARALGSARETTFEASEPLSYAEAFAEVAARTGDDELEAALATLIMGLRAMQSSTPPPPGFASAVNTLQAWAGQPGGIAPFASAA